MKNILKLITPLLAMLVLLTACCSEKPKVYTTSIDNQDLQVTIYYKGDSVNKVVSENTLTVDGDDINSAIESIKESIKNNNGHPINKYKAAVNVPENSLDEARKLS